MRAGISWRGWWHTTAGLVLAGTALTACGVMPSRDNLPLLGSDPATESEIRALQEEVSACLYSPSPESPAEAIVWMSPSASAEGIEMVDQLLTSSNSVVDYTFTDQEAALD